MAIDWFHRYISSNPAVIEKYIVSASVSPRKQLILKLLFGASLYHKFI